jgi:hypothetical protein
LDERDGTKGITWDMEDEFWEFMLGMLQFIPKKMEEKQVFPRVMTDSHNSTITFKSPKGLFLPSLSWLKS